MKINKYKITQLSLSDLQTIIEISILRIRENQAPNQNEDWSALKVSCQDEIDSRIKNLFITETAAKDPGFSFL